jgi:hypothetical protein
VATDIYQAWLTDRGIHSPVSQPFFILGSDIEANSLTVIVAQASAVDSSTVPAVMRLAHALKSIVSHPISWVVVDQALELPAHAVLRGLLPTLTNVVLLTSLSQASSNVAVRSSDDLDREDGYLKEELVMASRPLRVMHGPLMLTMASDLGEKKRFWVQLQAWLLPAV